MFSEVVGPEDVLVGMVGLNTRVDVDTAASISVIWIFALPIDDDDEGFSGRDVVLNDCARLRRLLWTKPQRKKIDGKREQKGQEMAVENCAREMQMERRGGGIPKSQRKKEGR